MTPKDDHVSRSELALIMRAAAEAQSGRVGEELISLDEAERIAAEVGIDSAEFRAAIRSLQAKKMGAKQFLGPSGVMSAEDTLPRPMVGDEGYQLLAEGQRSMTITGATIDRISDNIWCLGQGDRGELQVATRGDRTRVTALLDSRKAKMVLLAGPTVAGGIAGGVLLPAIAFVTLGTPEALALSNALGILGGSALGFIGGRAAWIAFAERSQERMYSALERMRALAGISDPSEDAPRSQDASR